MISLENILINITNVQKLTEEQRKETLKTTLSGEAANFLKESLYENDADVESVDVEDENTEEVVLPELETTDETNVDVEPEMEIEDHTDVAPDDFDVATETTDDEVLDLSDATLEEVMAALKDLDDDVVIEIKKNPATFNVEVDSEEKNTVESMVANEECDDCLEEEINTFIAENFQNTVQSAELAEYKKLVEQYELKLQNLTKQLSAKDAKLKSLTEEKNKYESVLVESQNVLNTLAVHNTNLLHITKLFTEQSVTKSEKVQIVEQFDKVKTIGESKVLFEALSTTFVKKPTNNETVVIKEHLNNAKTKKEIVKEEKTFVDPFLSSFDRFTKHKI